jgi:lysophospholipase L1-like esterase
MKRFFLYTLLVTFTSAALFAQTAPAGVCTYPEEYNFDEEVTWYFDLTGNAMVSPGQDLYLWMWEPVEIPGGPVLLTYLGEMTWSLTFTPTELLNVSLSTIVDAGNSAFWCHIETSTRTTVTGTIPYEQKEMLRQGLGCNCVGVPSDEDNTYFVNFGNSPVADPDSRGFYWTNVSEKNKNFQLVDTLGDHRYDISCSGDFLANNNSDFTNPDEALLGNLAVQQATESYMYLSSGTGTVTVSCLEIDRVYKLSIFGSRNTNSVRETKYTVTGFTSESGIVQTSGAGIATNTDLNCNDDEFFIVELYPAQDGTIEVLVEIQSGGFGYINMMKIEEVANPDVIEITGLEINTDNLSTTGPSQLGINYSPENTNQLAVLWTVDDESVAIIDTKGMLKPKKAGTVKVKATSVFSNDIADSITVTFADLVTEFYLTGVATEAGNDVPADALPMRMIMDADSTLTNLFEIFTAFTGSDSFSFISDNDGSGSALGGDGSGNLQPLSGNAIPSPEEGWKHVVINLNDSTYVVDDMLGWNVISHMLAKEAGEENEWGGTEILTEYEGRGVWSGAVEFIEPVGAEDNPRFFFELKGTGRAVKQIQGTVGKLVFTDQPGNIPTSDIQQFNGSYTITFDANTFTYDIDGICEEPDDYKVFFMGSSVAKGYGASVSSEDPSWYLGYAYHYKELLEERFQDGEGYDWNFANISIGGNTTVDLLNRMDQHLFTGCGKYVIYGLSLANEGIMSGGEPIFNQFRDNMLTLIDLAEANDMVPIIVGNYPNGSYTLNHYEYIKNINLLIHEWDVPSINVLGTLDDGLGKWVQGYYNDGGHPNNKGYEEFFHAMVPSLLDALAEGKEQPVRVEDTYISMGTDTNEGMLSFAPDGEVHSFTTAFDIKTNGTGTIASILSGNRKYRMSITETGKLKFAVDGGAATSIKTINDGLWHTIVLTHYFANESIVLYIDGSFAGSIEAQVMADSMYLCDVEEAPSSIDFRNWFFYRSGMNADEISELDDGAMLKSSLELYAPLDGQAALGADPLVNLAQSTRTLLQLEEDNFVGLSNPATEKVSVYPSPASEVIMVEIPSLNEAMDVHIYNSTGTHIRTERIREWQSSIAVGSLPDGLYFLNSALGTVPFMKALR